MLDTKSLLVQYKPLAIIVGMITVTTFAMQSPQSTWIKFMGDFMGLFLVVFSMFKLLDVEGFAKLYATYDIIAKRFPLYATLYPFIELLLGLALLNHFMPFFTNLIVLILMTVGAVGVIGSLGKDQQCACLGTILNVPLSAVSFLENVGMGAMALLMILTLG